MALKAEVDDLSTVEEPFRSLYTEKDGKHVLTGVEGLVPASALAAVKTEAGGYRIKLRTATEALEKFAGMDPAKVAAELARIPELELAATGKLDETKIEGIVSARLTTKVAPIQRELTAAIAERDGLKSANEQLVGKERSRVVSDAIRTASRAAKLLDSAVEDAILLGERIFEVNDDLTVTAKDKVGCTPGIDPAAWLQEMQPKRGHWWPPSIGGGGSGSRGGPGFSGVNPWGADTWNMTEQGAMVRADPKKAEQMAAAVGTTVGGLRPIKK